MTSNILSGTPGLDLNVQPRGSKTRTKGNGRTVAKHHAWAVRAVRRAAQKTRNFWNMKMAAPIVLLIIEAALRDEFEPKTKLVIKKEGTYLDNAIVAVLSEVKGVSRA